MKADAGAAAEEPEELEPPTSFAPAALLLSESEERGDETLGMLEPFLACCCCCSALVAEPLPNRCAPIAPGGLGDVAPSRLSLLLLGKLLLTGDEPGALPLLLPGLEE